MKNQNTGRLEGKEKLLNKRCHAELVSASSTQAVLKQQQQASKILNQVQDDFINNTTASGFTLIELLVVVLIIGILAAVALPQYQKATDKARFLQVMTVGEKISQAQMLYYLENGRFADTAEEVNANVPAGYTPQPFAGNEGVLVYKDFYCHTNSSGLVFCWFKNPTVGFRTNTPINTQTTKYRKCILCRSSNSTPTRLARAESICQAVSRQSLPTEGNCVSVDLP